MNFYKTQDTSFFGI